MKLTLTLLCLIFSTNLFALGCPSADQLIHIKGQAWSVAPSYGDRSYWDVKQSSAAMNSDYTSMPSETALEIWLYPNNSFPDKAICIYGDILHADSNIVLHHYYSINENEIPVPPFEQLPPSNGYRCTTTAALANKCNWGSA